MLCISKVNKLGAVAASSGPCLCNRTTPIDTVASRISLIGLYPLRKEVADEVGNAMTTDHEENNDKDGNLPKSLKFNEYGNQSEDGNLS